MTDHHSDRRSEPKSRGQDLFGIALLMLGGFAAASILLALRGQHSESLLAAPVEGLMNAIGATAGLVLSLALAGVGVTIFLRSEALAVGRHLVGWLGVALGLSLVVGAVAPDAAGALGGALPAALGGIGGRILAALIGLSALVVTPWIVWLGGEIRLPEKPVRDTPLSAETLEEDADGVTAAEAMALQPPPRPPLPKVADDIRNQGGIPEGARPLESDDYRPASLEEEDPGFGESDPFARPEPATQPAPAARQPADADLVSPGTLEGSRPTSELAEGVGSFLAPDELVEPTESEASQALEAPHASEVPHAPEAPESPRPQVASWEREPSWSAAEEELEPDSEFEGEEPAARDPFAFEDTGEVVLDQVPEKPAAALEGEASLAAEEVAGSDVLRTFLPPVKPAWEQVGLFDVESEEGGLFAGEDAVESARTPAEPDEAEEKEYEEEEELVAEGEDPDDEEEYEEEEEEDEEELVAEGEDPDDEEEYEEEEEEEDEEELVAEGEDPDDEEEYEEEEEEEDEEELVAESEDPDDEEEYEEEEEEEEDEEELVAEGEDPDDEEEYEEEEEEDEEELVAEDKEPEEVEYEEEEVVAEALDEPASDDFVLTPAVAEEELAAAAGVEIDTLAHEAGCLILEEKRVAVSMLQRRFTLDFDQACEVLDRLQKAGLIGPYVGGRSREILMSLEDWMARAPQPSV